MRRLIKALGVLAGLGAAVWLMRDRIVSLTVAREPEPPTFRTPAPRPPDDLTAIHGIGPTYAERLSAAGIRRFSDLAASSPAHVSEVAGVSEARAQDWVEQAAGLR
ncbi:MAG: helix-hairpin-helix domain-containing protein [Acidimicrobiia bacterium]